MKYNEGTIIKIKVLCAKCQWSGHRKTKITGYLHAQIAKLMNKKTYPPCPKCRYPVKIIDCKTK